jgi:esterase/lipase superfamily enzyme
MLREYHKWHSPALNREMELLVFGHAGARVVVFPTSMGRFFDWESRGLIQTLSRHIENGWLQLYCVDSVDSESWYNNNAHPHDRAVRHLQFQSYITQEVLPFSQSKNDNQFVIATGASFGGYHAISIGLRYPELFKRSLGMSGLYDVARWANGSYDAEIHGCNPIEFIRILNDDQKLEQIKREDIIIAIGEDDPSFSQNKDFSDVLWQRGVWHAFRVWKGNAHDWPFWQDMLLNYIGGVDSKD